MARRRTSTDSETSDLHEQAARWLLRQEAGPLSDTESRRYSRWLRESEAHRRSMEATRALARLGKALGDDVLLRHRASFRPTVAERVGLERRHTVWLGTAAGLLISVGLLLAGFWQAPFTGQRLVYATGVGEQEVIRLPDDSVLHLNTATRVDIDYSRSARALKLLRGEAHFEVRKDPARPFTVAAGSRIVRAVGTAFTISVDQSELEVLVSEGVVDVLTRPEDTPKQSAPERPRVVTTLVAQDSAVIGREGERVTRVETSEIARRLAWRQGMLAFEGETIGEVLHEVSRYSDVEIVVADEALNELRFGGLFRAGNTEALLEALRKSYGIRWNRVPGDRIVLTRETDE